MASERIGIVVGLRAEARIARPLGWAVAIGGGTAAGAERAAQKLLGQGVTALVSFGLAGGLDPALRPGNILVPETVLVDGDHLACDDALAAHLGGFNCHTMLGETAIIVTAEDKRDCWRETEANGVDLESGAVARIASAHNLPFAVLRAICDPANCSLPPAAQIALDHAGVIGLGRVLFSVLCDPRQIPDLFALADDAMTARKALKEHIARLKAA